MCSPPPECGPAAVAKVPLTISTKPAAVKRSASSRSSRGTIGGERPSRRPNASTTRTTAPASSDDREQEVRHHDRPAQVARNGEVAERRLCERAEEDERRNPAGPAREARRQPGGQKRDEGERDDDAPDEPVSELHEGVHVTCSGSGCPRSQPGQWRQPSPESVSRTAAPLPTISQRPARSRAQAGGSARARARGRCGYVRSRPPRRVTLEKGVEQLGVPVGAGERGRTRAEEERAIGGVEEHGHHVRPAELAQDPRRRSRARRSAGRCRPGRPGPATRNGTGSPEWMTFGVRRGSRGRR